MEPLLLTALISAGVVLIAAVTAGTGGASRPYRHRA